MPRLDNTTYEVIVTFRLPFNPVDPGATPPVDLCAECALDWPDTWKVAHPPYEECDYHCADCGAALGKDDE